MKDVLVGTSLAISSNLQESANRHGRNQCLFGNGPFLASVLLQVNLDVATL